MKRKKVKKLQLTHYSHPDKYGQWLGYKVEKFEPKKKFAQTSLLLGEKHLSPAGRVHGGVVSGFFDFSCGAAVFTTMAKNDHCSTIELKVNYFSPLHAGDRLTCHASVVFRGKRTCVIESKLYKKGQKDPVAMAMATFNVISR